MNPIFTRPNSFYKRNLDKLSVYHRQVGLYLSLMTGKPLELAVEYVKKQTKRGGRFPMFDPRVEYIDGNDEGNRKVAITTMSQYIAETVQKEQIMAATFTVYDNPNVRKSMTAKYAGREYKGRAKNKSTSQAYKAAGDMLRANIYNNRQNRNKIKLNSISGGHATKSSALFCASAHQTLTSTTCTGTENTNSTLERFLMGNRHYYNYEVTLQNIISIIDLSDLEGVKRVCDHYKLHYPTAEECLEHCVRSTSLYWQSRDKIQENQLKLVFEKMNEVQRAAWMYTYDLWSVRKFNDGFVRGLFDMLLSKPGMEKRMEKYPKVDDCEMGYIGIVLNDVLQCKEPKDYTEEEFNYVNNKNLDILSGLEFYKDFIEVFWLSRNMPHCVAVFPRSIRRSAIASDTDSAIFTTQDWVLWYCGKMDVTSLGKSVAGATCYLCANVVTHVLVAVMRNYGCTDEYIREFIMKNEFMFTFLSLTSMAKHYYGAQVAQEGRVFKEPDYEIKGATLKNSKADPEIMAKSNALIKHIGDTVMAGEEIVLYPILKDIANYEMFLINEIRQGNFRYFRNGQVKSKDSYKNENSMYLQYTLWEDVFAPKYGSVNPPPYGAINVNIDCDSKAKFYDWVDSLPDQEFAKRMIAWANRYKKFNGIKALWLPKEKISEIGIPEEVLYKIKDREMVLALMKSFYLILESLGYYTLNKNITHLVSDDL